MSKKIMGDLNVARNTLSFSKNTIRDVNNITADVNGDVIYPYYSKEEIDKIVATLPVSRIGTMDYLPMSINGSYEGATNYDTKRIFPVMLEDDGTMVLLRPGTNGSTFGYYYSYIPNARNSDSFIPIPTNTKYIPTFFTANHSLINFIGSNAGEILMMRTNNGTNDTYTLALTNGTMNSVSHQYVEFNRTLIPNTDPQYVMICNGIAYIWCIDSYNNADPFSISLYTISVDNIRNGVTTTLSRITGFSGKTLYGDNVTGSSNIQITPKLSSTVTSDKPFTLGVPNGYFLSVNTWQLNTDGAIQAVGNDNNTSIRVSVSHAYDSNSSTGNLSQKVWGFSFTYNISTKAYAYDTTSLAPIVVTANASTGAVTSTTQFDVRMENINGFPSGSHGNVPTIFQTLDGQVFSAVARYVTTADYKVTRATISGFTSKFDSLNLTTRTLTNQKVTYVQPQYGSVIGENLINPQIISPTKIVMAGSGTENGVTFGFNSLVSTDFTGSRNYVYQSVNGSPINGYAPNINRAHLTNTNLMYNAMISIVAQDGTTKVYGSSFIEGAPNKPANGLLNPSTMQFTGSYTLQNAAVLTTLKNNILSRITLPDNILDSKIVLYYVPDQSLCKSIAAVMVRTDAAAGTNNINILTAEVDLTLSGTVVTGGTVLSTFSNQRGLYSTNINTNLIERMCGLTVAKYSDFTYLGVGTVYNSRTTGNDMYCSILGKIDNSTQRISSSALTLVGTQYVALGGAFQVGVIPNVGFGVFETGQVADLGTKLVFKNFGTTSAQFDTMITDLSANPIERFVITSQEVAQGFNVYFTQIIPILLNGKYYEMLPTTINLNSIESNPANKTFYIYIVINEGVAQYQISTSILSDELYRVFIGTIVTGASSITSLVTEKVTRFLTYRPSVTKRGSAIPASTGVPSGTGTRWH
ncbi:putative structural protein [Erwinia phage pEa_SNUABM_50]|uniref:Putative structural protein n=1 Tax=Erwinia phage pEa_SNUABM_50 TaxID=2768775 RepID=A0A7L8ZNX2_9CAUD|nr:putative structural protein [Erwinia phage pEa_SNUABM_50]